MEEPSLERLAGGGAATWFRGGRQGSHPPPGMYPMGTRGAASLAGDRAGSSPWSWGFRSGLGDPAELISWCALSSSEPSRTETGPRPRGARRGGSETSAAGRKPKRKHRPHNAYLLKGKACRREHKRYHGIPRSSRFRDLQASPQRTTFPGPRARLRTLWRDPLLRVMPAGSVFVQLRIRRPPNSTIFALCVIRRAIFRHLGQICMEALRKPPRP